MEIDDGQRSASGLDPRLFVRNRSPGPVAGGGNPGGSGILHDFTKALGEVSANGLELDRGGHSIIAPQLTDLTGCEATKDIYHVEQNDRLVLIHKEDIDQGVGGCTLTTSDRVKGQMQVTKVQQFLPYREPQFIHSAGTECRCFDWPAHRNRTSREPDRLRRNQQNGSPGGIMSNRGLSRERSGASGIGRTDRAPRRALVQVRGRVRLDCINLALCHLAFWNQRVLFVLRGWQSGEPHNMYDKKET